MNQMRSFAASLARQTMRWVGYTPQRIENNVLVGPTTLPPETQARQLLRFVRVNQPEIEAEDCIVRIFEQYDINVVIDVGANVGQYGSRLRSVGYRGHIISFEPIAAAFQQLEERARSDQRWTVRRMALGRQTGDVSLHVARNSAFSSFLKTNPDGTRLFGVYAEPERCETVPVRTLDDVIGPLIEGIPSPRLFLKLDTQGYDLEVCAGARAFLPRMLGVQTELSVLPIYDRMPTWLESVEFFQRAGFVIAGLVPINHDVATLQVVEFDGLFVHASRT